jgi:Lar family restriction alleviation protein
MANELLPCPFCGEATNLTMKETELRRGYVYKVMCEECGCSMTFKINKALAVSEWNRRTPDKSQAKRIEALAGALRGFNLKPDMVQGAQADHLILRVPNAVIAAAAAALGTTPAPDALTESGRAALQDDK